MKKLITLSVLALLCFDNSVAMLSTPSEQPVLSQSADSQSRPVTGRLITATGSFKRLADINRRISYESERLSNDQLRRQKLMDRIHQVCNKVRADRTYADRSQNMVDPSLGRNSIIVTYADGTKKEIDILGETLAPDIIEVEVKHPSRESIYSLLPALRSNSTLKKLIIRSVYLADSDLMSLAEIAVNNKELECFRLDVYCHIPTAVCADFFEQVMTCEKLQFSGFYLGSNNSAFVRSCNFSQLTILNQSIQRRLGKLNALKDEQREIMEQIPQQCAALKEEE